MERLCHRLAMLRLQSGLPLSKQIRTARPRYVCAAYSHTHPDTGDPSEGSVVPSKHPGRSNLASSCARAGCTTSGSITTDSDVSDTPKPIDSGS